MATCGRLRSNIAGNPCTARSFWIHRMVCYGRLGAVVLPSHGRGPRFDPLCAHHASPFRLRMAQPAQKSPKSGLFVFDQIETAAAQSGMNRRGQSGNSFLITRLRASPIPARFIRAMARRFGCRSVRFRLPVSRESRIARGDDFELSTSAWRRQSHDRSGSQSHRAGAGRCDGRKGQDGSCGGKTIRRSRRKPQR